MLKYTREKRYNHFLTTVFCIALILLSILVGMFVAGYVDSRTPESYLPEIEVENACQELFNSDSCTLEGSNFKLIVTACGNITIRSTPGNTLLSRLHYYSFHNDTIEKVGLNNIAVKFANDSTILLSGYGPTETIVKISFVVLRKSNKLDVITSTDYIQTTKVEREALVLVSELPVMEVYKKNRRADQNAFASEYWLDKQGVLFGNKENSLWIYNVPNVSSLQLNTESKTLFINLDYYRDHPYTFIPYQKNGEGLWEDRSASLYPSGSSRVNQVTVFVDCMLNTVPRIMAVPGGYLAGYVFTEHADGGNLRTHRAVYFGSDTVQRVENAIGGFVKNKIPVTKSIFYSNPDNEAYCSVTDDADSAKYLEFLDQLYETGDYELCLHTPEGVTSSRQRLSDAISFMKDRYDAITWIDHGMETGESNRECFLTDGLDPNSGLYSADLWKEHNTLYFWNVGVEKLRKASYVSIKESVMQFKILKAFVLLWQRYYSPEELDEVNFFRGTWRMLTTKPLKNELNSYVTLKGESYPTPLFYKHFTRTGDFISWVTDFTYDIGMSWTRKASQWYLQEINNLNRLVDQGGIFINHGYYIRNIPNTDMTLEANNSIVTNPYFEKMLKYMALQRDNGDLYVTTIRDLLHYWTLCEKISFEYFNDGTITVSNNNEVPVKGLSLVISNSDVVMSTKKHHTKTISNETVVWFDIEAKEKIQMRLIPICQETLGHE
ncbi:MAG TPA: hypothetical protein PLQ82_03150 [Desulfobacteraceae bacterium]|nr:hypothetical protein [Desulfobacteraceae bacterium]HPQ27448.1 hypothetical protein [Desulfobacteraceae bacterium]